MGAMRSSADAPGSTLSRAVAAADFLRRSPVLYGGGTAGYKEWLHFCVLAPELELLVNFSFSDDLRRSDRGAEIARLTVLVRNEAWDGDVETFRDGDIQARGGAVDLALGESRLRFRDGRYALRMRLRERPVAADLVLRPLTAPARAPNIPMIEGPALHWIAIPRLAATGTVTVGGHTHRLVDVNAYHDHNFGHLLWGRNFSWRWAFALPLDAAQPWTFTFASLADRARSHALSQGVFLWKGADRCRTFRDHDIEIRPDVGFLAPRHVFKVPRVMALLSPETTTDVPRSLELDAAAEGDRLHYEFEAQDLAQVVIPNEVDLGVTVLRSEEHTPELQSRGHLV